MAIMERNMAARASVGWDIGGIAFRQCLAESRHVGAQRRAGRAGTLIVAPKVFGQPADRCDLIGPDRQKSQESMLPVPTDAHRHTVVHDAHAAKDPNSR